MAIVNADFIHADGQVPESVHATDGQSAAGSSVASYFASIRKAIARRRQNAATGTVEGSGFANAGTGTQETVSGGGTECTAIDHCVVAELARAGEYIDNAEYQAAAARTGISLREYSAGLYSAYIQAGGDPESEQAVFLRNIADNPDYEGLMIDRIQRVSLAEGQATFLGASDGRGNGVIGVGTSVSASTYCSLTGDYNADEQRLAATLTQMSEGYARFDVAGIGRGGDAAVIAAMQQKDDTVAHMNRLASVNGEGFPHRFVQNHAEDAERIAARTTNYRPAGSGHTTMDAAAYLGGGAASFIGTEAIVAAADSNASDASWMNWSIRDDGSFAEGAGVPGGMSSASGSGSGGGGGGGAYDDPYTGGAGGGGGSGGSRSGAGSSGSSGGGSGGGGGGSSGGGGGGEDGSPYADDGGDSTQTGGGGGVSSGNGGSDLSGGSSSGNSGGDSSGAGGGGSARGPYGNDSGTDGDNYSDSCSTTGSGGLGGSGGSGGNATEIQYDSQPVLDCAAKLIEIARQLSAQQETMQSKLTASGTVWECASSTSVRSEVQRVVKSVMTSGHDYMDHVAKRLCRTDENYQKVEKAIKDANDSVASAFA